MGLILPDSFGYLHDAGQKSDNLFTIIR